MDNYELYKRVYLIRSAEEAIIERYMQDEMKTPAHLSLGEEAISAGVCYALEDRDQMVGTYRSHGIFLARTFDTDAFFGEMYGRVTGVGKGKAGSMHLSHKKHGFLGSSAVVATNIPVGLGAAFANKYRGGEQIVAIFFGDGAIDEGAFFESLNFAALRGLRVLFVCEDNGLAIHSPARDRHGYREITDIVQQYRCDVYSSESTVASDIYTLAKGAVAKIRETSRPAFLHLKYYRYKEHVGPNEDFQFGYRSRDDYERWLDRDPVKVQRPLAVEETSQSSVEALEAEIDQKVLDSIKKAEAAPFAAPEELYTDVIS